MMGRVFAVGSLLGVIGCGAAEPVDRAGPPLPPPASAGARSADVSYLVIAPRAYADELAPLLKHRSDGGLKVELRDIESIYDRRSGGRYDKAAIQMEIEAQAALPDSKLHFVLLAGDPQADLPAFMHEASPWVSHPETYPSDYDYVKNARVPIAIGRLPARSEQEISLFVDKTIRYETEEKPGPWQRRTLIFGGPAEMGPLVDGLIESQATSLLDQLLPYDYDVNVLFAKKDSPYAFRFDQLSQELVREINGGALVAVYAGHGLERSFDRAYFRGQSYAIGSVPDLEHIDVDNGSPLFISLTCLTGDYGEPSQRSVAETMLLRPRGPIAIFASSGVSHPYPNLLYARLLIEGLLGERAATIGDAVLRAKKELPSSSMPFAQLFVPGDHDEIKSSHLQLYNLLGDPALKLRLPAPLAVSLPSAGVGAGATFDVEVKGAPVDSAFIVTLETERVAVKPGITTPDRLDEMPLDAAFLAMSKNHALANDKVISTTSGRFKSASEKLTLTAPKQPGRYVVKVLSSADRGVAVGHARFTVQ
jgi:hypothetical protein